MLVEYNLTRGIFFSSGGSNVKSFTGQIYSNAAKILYNECQIYFGWGSDYFIENFISENSPKQS